MNETRLPASPEELVGAFVDSEKRFPAYCALQKMGRAALPAVREGLKHGNWQVRRWCAMYLDQNADAESLERLIPLLRDPKSLVRLWAVHSISCEECKEDECPVDVVPLLIERIEIDESIRVRRMAVAMLAIRAPDARVLPAFKMVLDQDSDRKLRLHAETGLHRYREAGLV